jgi:hypothetical protein
VTAKGSGGGMMETAPQRLKPRYFTLLIGTTEVVP